MKRNKLKSRHRKMTMSEPRQKAFVTVSRQMLHYLAGHQSYLAGHQRLTRRRPRLVTKNGCHKSGAGPPHFVFVQLYLCVCICVCYVFTNMVLIPSSPIRCPVIIGLVLRSVTTYNYLMSIQMICLLIVCSNVPSDAEIEPSLYLLSLCICICVFIFVNLCLCSPLVYVIDLGAS